MNPSPHRPWTALLGSLAVFASSHCGASIHDVRTTPLPAEVRLTAGRIQIDYSSFSAKRSDATLAWIREHESSFMEAFSRRLEQRLREFNAEADPAAASLVIDITFTDISPGNQSLRYWVGFGAGSAYVELQARMGQYGDFKASDTLSFGFFGGELEGTFENLADGVVDEIAELAEV